METKLQQAGNILAELNKTREKAKAESRELTAEEVEAQEKGFDLAVQLMNEYETEQKASELDQRLRSLSSDIHAAKKESNVELISLREIALIQLGKAEKVKPEMREQYAQLGMTHQIGNYGGTLVRQDVANEIYSGLLADTNILKNARKFPMSGQSLPIPIGGSAFTWTVSGKTEPYLNTGEDLSGSLRLTPWTIAGKMPVSLELIEDAATNFEAWLTNMIREQAAQVLENLFTNGTGAQQPTGHIVSGQMTTVATSGTSGALEAADIYGLEFHIPNYRANAIYMANSMFWKAVAGLKGTDVFYWNPEGLRQRQMMTVRGVPAVINDFYASPATTIGNASTNNPFCSLADWNHLYAVGVRKEVEVEFVRDSASLDGGGVYVYARLRYDGKVLNKNAGILLIKGS